MGNTARVGINQMLARSGHVAERIPAWEEFAGPVTGMVELPNRLCWSGNPHFSIDDPSDRLSLYTTLIGDGQRGDLARWINREYLLADWPHVRKQTSRLLTRVWEELLPALAAA
jgi:hypothetical protein